MSNLRIEFTDDAEEDLAEIIRYSATVWGQDQAIVYVERLLERTLLIQKFPSIGRVSSMFREPTRVLVSAEHMIMYAVRDDVIVILRIVHHQLNLGDLSEC